MSELAELIARRDEVLAELQEIESLAAEGAGRILEAVKAQDVDPNNKIYS